jgi:regulatory protein
MRPKTIETRATAPDASSLEKAALDHLARYATTRASLTAVLDRRVRRWADQASADDPDTVAAKAGALRDVVRALVARLAESGLVDDRAFAESRTRRLVRTGRSRSAILVHLVAKGIERRIAEDSLPSDEDTELLAALAFARRRRCGPFEKLSDRAADAPSQARALAAFARAGFRHDIARRALEMGTEEAIRRLGTADPTGPDPEAARE